MKSGRKILLVKSIHRKQNAVGRGRDAEILLARMIAKTFASDYPELFPRRIASAKTNHTTQDGTNNRA